MQAHPLSSTAARITSTSFPASSVKSIPASIPAPSCIRIPLTDPSAPLPATTPTVVDAIGLAHDAGNLLAALGLYCDLLSAPGVLRPEHKHYATELSLISNRSSTLIRRLLTGSLETVLHAPQPEVSNLLSLPHAAVLRNLAPILQRIAAGAAKISVTCPTSLPPLDFPPEIIERIAVNLVRNAAEAIRIQRRNIFPAALPPHGKIHVSLAVAGPELQLTVEDNGPGMPPAVVAAFLHPSPLPQGAHHGIGHRIIHQLAAISAGGIAIRVLPGSGTIFSLKWPIQTTRLSEPRTMNVPTIEAHMAAPEGSSNC
jgi:signal transduction histidine kinase